MSTNGAMAEPLQELRTQGYAVLRSFWSKDHLAKMLAEAERWGPGEGATSSRSGMVLRSRALRDAVSDPRVVTLATSVLGDDVWVPSDRVVAAAPGAGRRCWRQAAVPGSRSHLVLWAALSDGQTLHVAPASHLRGPLPHNTLGADRAEVTAPIGESLTLELQAGDVVVLSSMLLHTPEENPGPLTHLSYLVELRSCAESQASAEAPFFVLAEGGEAAACFVAKRPGPNSLGQQLRSLGAVLGLGRSG